MPAIMPEDVWIFIYDEKQVRSTQLENQFIDEGLSKRISRGTLYKYKRDLEKEGKIKAKPILEARPPYNVYYVPEEFHDKVEYAKQRRRIKSILDNLSPKGQIKTFDIWLEIEEVVHSMTKMGYPPEEIRGILTDSLEEFHSRLVDRIVRDAEKMISENT